MSNVFGANLKLVHNGVVLHSVIISKLQLALQACAALGSLCSRQFHAVVKYSIWNC